MVSDDQYLQRLHDALNMIRSVYGYLDDVDLLLFHRILYDFRLRDRAQLSFAGTLRLGPEAVAGSTVSLAGTLIHEAHHMKQPLLYKTWSFWRGVVRREHPHKWLEWPAYEAQAAFLRAAAGIGVPGADIEAVQVIEAFQRHYGTPPSC